MGCLCCCGMKASHNLPYANPSRIPPDPELFPRYFQNKQGLWLHFTEWAPPRDVPCARAVLFIVSGLNEHAGRYDSVALHFARAGYHVFCMDNQGAGGSEGERLYVEDFYDFVDDFQLFRRRMLASYPDYASLPQFLLGHSMGGLIATHVALRNPSVWAGVVLSGPVLEVNSDVVSPLKEWLVKKLSHCLPKLGVQSLKTNFISTNIPVVQQAIQDPFCANVKLTTRWGAEVIRAMDDVRARMEHTTFPLLIVHGTDDKLCPVGGSRRFIAEVVTSDKKMIEYDGLYHEVLTEVRRVEVLKDVEEFFNKHFC